MNEGYIDVLHDRPALMKMLCELNLAGDGDEIHVQMLTGGVSSNIFRIDLHSGPVCVKQALPKLKVEKEWHVPTNRVLAEIDWLTTAARIVPGNVPRILGADRVRGAFGTCGTVRRDTGRKRTRANAPIDRVRPKHRSGVRARLQLLCLTP